MCVISVTICSFNLFDQRVIHPMASCALLPLCIMSSSQRERGLLVVRGQKRHLAQRLRLPPHHVLLRELPSALLLPGRLQNDHRARAEEMHALPVQVGASATAARCVIQRRRDWFTPRRDFVRVCVSKSGLELQMCRALSRSRPNLKLLYMPSVHY